MIYSPAIHNFAQLIKSMLGYLALATNQLRYSNDELLVVNYHSTPKKFDNNFEKQLVFFIKHFNVISPHQIESFYSHKSTENRKCSLLITFDDGLKNNLHAIKILDKYNIKVFFFVIPDFINTSKKEQKNYYLKNIRPVVNGSIDNRDEDFAALSWGELKRIIDEGHAVGSHTKTHTLLAAQSDTQNSFEEIVVSKKIIETELQISVTSFCSINNTSLSVSKKEKEMISANYKFHFTTFPGYNYEAKNQLFIKRRNIEAFWLMGAVYFAISKLDLRRWKARIKNYNDL